ncbi:helix-turn-helix domain-containing protein [Denitrificimonas caeni]|uniref:Helix-turn-helix domain-containing protein n=1 Tax=Denitrificimonas caeni TaxID=521720 RepID=A0AAE9VMD8_9GAMM|nr:helix-turn-helix domain-containing protein [Denitrificimonas caeni]WBE24750.1 helix-turn-helix domain-containing protein [Denitrificimonas caeni]
MSQAIAEILASRVPRQEDVAQHCALSLRTLQRRLHEAGSSYQQLLDEVRFTQAKTQLSSTQKPLHSIAEQLGFIEPRSFFRFFKRRAGVTPGQYREQHKA